MKKEKYIKSNIRGNIKRITASVLVTAMLFSLSACSTPEGTVGGDFDIDEKGVEYALTGEGQSSSHTSSNDDYTGDDNVSADAQEAFQAYKDAYFERIVTADSLNYKSYIHDGALFNISAPPATLGDSGLTDEQVERDLSQAESDLAALDAIDRDGLSTEDRITYDMMYSSAEANVHANTDYLKFSDPFSPNNGFQEGYDSNFTDYIFENKEDVELYIELLGQTLDLFNECLEFEYKKAEWGTFMSDSNCEKVIDQCNDFISDKENHFMIESFNDRIDELDFLTDEEKEDYKKQNKDAVLNSLIPAYERVIEVMTELKGKGVMEGGLAASDEGRQYYEYLFKARTASDMTPQEGISYLEQKYSELILDMQTIAITDSDSYQYFSDNYGELTADSDTKDPAALIDEIAEMSKKEFPDIGKIDYTVSYLDPALEKIKENTLAYYNTRQYDNPSSNIIRINGLHKDGQFVTLAHEGIPGHMYEFNYWINSDPDPARFLLRPVGALEGWAVYASYDMLKYYDFGADNNENVADLERINTALGYWLYAYLDLRVNYSGWTVEDCESFMDEMGYNSGGAADIYDTVSGDPAVYQAYGTAYLLMQDERDRAEEALGDKFDPIEYHAAVLEYGPVTFTVLDKLVDNYIKENQ